MWTRCVSNATVAEQCWEALLLGQNERILWEKVVKAQTLLAEEKISSRMEALSRRLWLPSCDGLASDSIMKFMEFVYCTVICSGLVA